MYELMLTKEGLDNLKIFLTRVQLSGQEVGAYNQLTKAIIDAEIEVAEKAKELEPPKKAGDK